MESVADEQDERQSVPTESEQEVQRVADGPSEPITEQDENEVVLITRQNDQEAAV